MGRLLLIVAALFALASLDAEAQAWTTTQVEKWKVDRRIDAVSDEREISLRLDADEGLNNDGDPIWLRIRCRGGGLYAEIRWGTLPGLFVTTTFGYDLPERKMWIVSPADYLGTRPPVGGQWQFVTALMNTERFVARVEPPDQRPMTALFDTYGLKRVLTGSRECGLDAEGR